MSSKIVAVLLLTFMSVTISNALKCYQCFPEQPSCNGPNLDSAFLQDCVGLFNKCLITGNVDYSNQQDCLVPADQCVTVTTTTAGATTTGRGCSIKSALKEGCLEESAFTNCTSLCSTDGCNSDNGVGSIKISSLGLLVTAILGWFLSSF